MNDLICPGIRCQAIREHWIVYRDKDHLTGAFAQSLAPMLEARLFQLPFTQSLAVDARRCTMPSGAELHPVLHCRKGRLMMSHGIG
jgi:hypothetical protein